MWNEHIIAYWAKRIGLEPNDFEGKGLTIHFIPLEHPRLFIYRFGERTMVLLPDNTPSAIQETTHALSDDSDETITAAFSALQPTFRYTDPIYFWKGEPPVVQNDAIRILTHDDAALFDELQATCSEEDRDLAEISIEDIAPHGYFVDDKLVSVASLLEETEDIVDIGVITHPDYRRRGFSVALTKAVTAWALAQGKDVQYTSQNTNLASINVAEKSGFTLFMTETVYGIEGLAD